MPGYVSDIREPVLQKKNYRKKPSVAPQRHETGINRRRDHLLCRQVFLQIKTWCDEWFGKNQTIHWETRRKQFAVLWRMACKILINCNGLHQSNLYERPKVSNSLNCILAFSPAARNTVLSYRGFRDSRIDKNLLNLKSPTISQSTSIFHNWYRNIIWN